MWSLHCEPVIEFEGDHMRNTRRLMMTFVVVTLSVMAIATHAHAVDAAKRPNILLIVADDLGYGELGCQGNPQIPTPNIDSLAKSGIRFTSGYVSGPYCSPTRAGLMTGRYQQRFGHEFNPGPNAPENFGLSRNENTLADRLTEAGYATGMFGKWHLGEGEFHPQRRGFDEYFGFLGGAHPYFNPRGTILRGTTPVDKIEYTTTDFARETVSFIEKNREKPWFVYLPFNAVHGPLEAPQKHLDRFGDIPEGKRRTFAAMLSAMDDAIGSVLTKLRERQLEENTLIFFFSDNGGPTAQTTSRNDPLSGFKSQIMEGGVRVPFIVQWKGHLPAGKVDDRPIIQLDIHPTALAAAGVTVKPDAKFDGVNLLPYLTGNQPDLPHAALYWRFGRQRAVRQGDWKLNDMGDGVRLYNLASDIGERTDLAAKEPGKLKELEATYANWNRGNIEAAWGRGGGKKADTGQTKSKKKKKKSTGS
jgi:arylsulfatase A-like enzyme